MVEKFEIKSPEQKPDQKTEETQQDIEIWEGEGKINETNKKKRLKKEKEELALKVTPGEPLEKTWFEIIVDAKSEFSEDIQILIKRRLKGDQYRKQIAQGI